MSAVHQLRPETTSVEELAELVRERSFRTGRFELSSGAVSDRYFNLKPTMMSPRGALLAARAFLGIAYAENIQFVGGLEMGAVPLIGAMAAVGCLDGRPIDTFFVRKAAKAHGTREQVEGLGPGQSLSGQRVMVVDDVATSGKSIMQAVDAARAVGGVIDVALVLLDRQEGAEAHLAEQGIRLRSVLKASDFG